MHQLKSDQYIYRYQKKIILQAYLYPEAWLILRSIQLKTLFFFHYENFNDFALSTRQLINESIYELDLRLFSIYFEEIMNNRKTNVYSSPILGNACDTSYFSQAMEEIRKKIRPCPHCFFNSFTGVWCHILFTLKK